MEYKKDIQNSQYRNPFFSKKAVKVNKVKVLSLIFLIIAGYWVYLVFYSPYLSIKRITVSNLEYIEKEEIIDIAKKQMDESKFFIFKQDRFFLLDEDDLKNKIEKKFLINAINFEKKGFNGLDIYIEEKISSITWISGDKYYYLDIDGNIKKEVRSTEVNRNFPIIYQGTENTGIISGKHIIDGIKIIEEIKNNTKFEAVCFKYFSDDKLELHAKTNKDFEIYFDLNLDIGEQLKNLYILLRQKLDVDKETFNYIDLRFGERVYYQ